MFRTVLVRARQAARPAIQRVGSQLCVPLVSAQPIRAQSIRLFATSQSDIDAKFQAIGDAVRSDPEMKENILELKKIFEEKGIIQDGKPPNLFKVSSLLMDKNVTQRLKTLYEQLEKKNISCTPEDLKSLMEMYKS